MAGIRMRKNLYFKYSLVLLVLFCFAGLAAEGVLQSTQSRSSSLPETGRVIAVYDGDTIKVRFKDKQEYSVRLIGVNAPEIGFGREELKFRAEMSKRFVFYYLYDKKIRLSYEGEVIDQYGRVLAFIWTEEQGLFNEFIISEGFASALLTFRFSYSDEFKEAERVARNNGKGTWKRRDYTRIQATETKSFIGQIVTVEFQCANVRTQRKYVYIDTSEREFSAIISKENISSFPLHQSYRKKVLSITGFLEEYKGKPQIMVFFPSQIEIKGQ
ncbi:MAG: thermonuclease family protein [Candidatus Aminicenantes bacterium]|nr:thermonuclease family protein [Candidatus Aminicenantes bacterium]